MQMPRPGFDDTIAASMFLAIATAACLMPVQSDTWWHLRAGLDMWRQHAVMLHDRYSYTAAGAYWPNHEWLSDVLFYGVYRLAGLPGVTALAAACVVTAVAWSWRLMRGPAVGRLVLLAIAIPCIVPVWTVRPHVFSLLLVMVALALVMRERYWPLPFLFALWANLHGGVALGFVVLAGAALADVWPPSRGTVTSPSLRRWIVIGLLCFAATLVTPLGVHLWSTIPESVHKSMANGITEWRPAALAWHDAPFWALAAAFLIVLLVKRRTIDTREKAVLACTALLLLPTAIRYSRNISPCLLIVLPALSRLVALPSAQRRARAERYGLNTALVGAGAVAAIIVVTLAWGRPAERLHWRPISPSIVDAVRSCPARLYNRFDDGGYLIWFAPGVPVFVDNRQDPYPLAFLQQHLHMEQQGRFQQVFQQYRIGCAFLPPSSPTAQRLLAAGWRVRAEDGRWVVLQKPPGTSLRERAP